MNSIFVISLYRYSGLWVFDDPERDLVKEPFVSGAPEVIDLLVREIPEAAQGFNLLFSATAFPGHQAKLTWQREETDGNWYLAEPWGLEGWLCPALLKYFTEPPTTIFVQATAKS